MTSLKKALETLSHFADTETPLGVFDLADLTGLSKSYISRTLKVLRDEGFLEQDKKTRKYRIGINAFALASGYPRQNRLVQSAWPHMREISQKTMHTVYLSIRNHDHCRHVMAVEGAKFRESQWRVGIRLPMHATASGKLLSAYLSDDKRDELFASLALPRFTRNTIVDLDTLKAALKEIKTEGFAVARGETVEGLAATSVPIFGKSEEAIGALGVVSPENQLNDTDLKKVVKILWLHASMVSATQGAQVYPMSERV